MAKRGPKSPLTEEHKNAMAVGRAEGRIVRQYLHALRTNKPKRGRKRTPETIRAQINAIDEQIADANPIEELQLVQKRRDLLTELSTLGSGINLPELEKEFVRIAKAYSERQGISYASWRDVGVTPAVLKRAKITR